MSERLLLDTHVLLWALSAPSRLPRRLAARLRDPAVDVLVSAVSTWEIAIKSGLGKVDVHVPAIVAAVQAAHFEELPVSIAHTARVSTLPPLHRDPFDRLLIAQALEEHLTLVTHDQAVAAYEVRTLWN